MTAILHITTREQWEKAKNLGNYRSESLATEGFMNTCHNRIGGCKWSHEPRYNLEV